MKNEEQRGSPIGKKCGCIEGFVFVVSSSFFWLGFAVKGLGTPDICVPGRSKHLYCGLLPEVVL